MSPPGIAGDQSSSTAVELSAEDKLRAVVAAAWAAGPDLAERIAWIDAEAATNRSAKGSGNPFVEFQWEGIGPSFDARPNTQQYLRVGTPFNMPWQFVKTGRLENTLKV